MRVNLLLFASVAEAFGNDQLALDLPEPVAVTDVDTALRGVAPAATELPSLRFAVNQEFVDDAFLIREGDEVAVIPPVAGG